MKNRAAAARTGRVFAFERFHGILLLRFILEDAVPYFSRWLALALLSLQAFSQSPQQKQPVPSAKPHTSAQSAIASGPAQSSLPAVPPNLLSSLHWRSIGPYRGGRTRAVAGVPSQPNVFYI